jgi:hypothetical protein
LSVDKLTRRWCERVTGNGVKIDTVPRARPADLADRNGLREVLGVSKQRVQQLTERDDFPAPWAVWSIGPVWDVRKVREWDARRKAKEN